MGGVHSVASSAVSTLTQSFYNLTSQASVLDESAFIFTQEPLPTRCSQLKWKDMPLSDLQGLIASQAQALRKDGAIIFNARDVMKLMSSIVSQPKGVATTIEWRTGKLQFLTRRTNGQTWQVVQRKFSQSIATPTQNREETVCFKYAEVDSLDRFMQKQCLAIRMTNPEFSEDDEVALLDSIKKSPQGLSLLLEWDTGRWQMKIFQDGDEEDVWHCYTKSEQARETVAAITAPAVSFAELPPLLH